MLKSIAGAVLCAVALGSTPAGAKAEEYATGWIAVVDWETDRIMLDDGRTFIVSGDLNLSALHEGVEVRIAFKRTERGKKAMRIVPAARQTPPKKRSGGV